MSTCKAYIFSFLWSVNQITNHLHLSPYPTKLCTADLLFIPLGRSNVWVCCLSFMYSAGLFTRSIKDYIMVVMPSLETLVFTISWSYYLNVHNVGVSKTAIIFPQECLPSIFVSYAYIYIYRYIYFRG